MVRFFHSSRGFTLFELMIVMSMIALLLWSGIFPYMYYMDRARVEKTIDTISQEWIIAHQNIRWGLLHEGSGSHAHMYIEIKEWDGFITFSTSTGWSSTKKEFKRYVFDPNIKILELTGSIDTATTDLIYHISPPFATGAFFTGGLSEVTMTGVILTVGYPGASRDSRRARDMILRPYFD